MAKRKIRYLYPLKESFRLRDFIGFDIETYGKKNTFYMGSLFNKRFHDVCYSQDDMVKTMKKRCRELNSPCICATNLGFDLLGTLKDTVHIKDLYPMFRNGRMISAVHGKGKHSIKFIDTLNFLNMSVQKIGDEILHLPKMEKPLFLGKRPKNQEEEMYLIAYNKRDSEISYKVMDMLQSYYAQLNTRMKITASSTSLDCFRRNFLDREIKVIGLKELLLHKRGYYGGRTETFIRGKVNQIDNVRGYDINSLYPYVMQKYKYPDPNTIQHTLGGSLRHLYDYEGICDCVVSCYDQNVIPYLPYRQENGRLIFPLGRFRGVFSFFELREAIKLGYTVESINEMVTYSQSMSPFKKFVDDYYNLRLKFKKENNVGMSTLCKLNMNSLYGKFFQDVFNDRIVRHVDSLEMGDIQNYIQDGYQESIAGKDEEWRYYDKKKLSVDDIPAFVIPIWSIYVTSYARHTLYQYFLEIKRQNKRLFYCDTDSVFTDAYLNTSNELGDMKKEYDIKQAVFIRPKFYMVEDMNGKTYVKVKGIRGLDKQSFLEKINQSKNGKVSFNYTKFATFSQCNRLYRDTFLSYNEIMDIEKIYSTEDEKRLWYEKFNPTTKQYSTPIIL